MQENILALIHGQVPERIYIPGVFFEGAIKLTLGKGHYALYSSEADGSDVLVTGRNNRLDLGVERAWKQFGAGDKFKTM